MGGEREARGERSGNPSAMIRWGVVTGGRFRGVNNTTAAGAELDKKHLWLQLIGKLQQKSNVCFFFLKLETLFFLISGKLVTVYLMGNSEGKVSKGHSIEMKKGAFKDRCMRTYALCFCCGTTGVLPVCV